MPTRTFTHLMCPCGYRGTVEYEANSSPYGKEWHRSRFFDGDFAAKYPGRDMTFQEYGQMCPNCKRTGSAASDASDFPRPLRKRVVLASVQ
jgi:hypothetical protein